MNARDFYFYILGYCDLVGQMEIVTFTDEQREFLKGKVLEAYIDEKWFRDPFENFVEWFKFALEFEAESSKIIEKVREFGTTLEAQTR